MARFRMFLDGEGIATTINLDAVLYAKMRDKATIYVVFPGAERTLRVTLDKFHDALTGDDMT